MALQQQQSREQELFAMEKSSSSKEDEKKPAAKVVYEPEMKTLVEPVVNNTIARHEENSKDEAYQLNQGFKNIPIKKMIEFNGINSNDIITRNQLIFLEKKSKRGAKDFHIVAPNERLHDIAQKEGVQLQSLFEYNKMQRGMEPAIGEKIYLKWPSPTTPRLASGTLAAPAVSMK